MLAAQFVPRDFLEGVVIRVSEVAPLAQAAAFAMAIVMIDALGPEGVSPFIYFRF
jgi:hypothetical protein